MDERAASQIKSVLEPDEELLWAGRPRSGIRINTRGKSFRLSAAILGLIVAVVATGAFVSDGQYFGHSIAPAFFLLIVMYFVATPMLMDLYGPKEVDYGLTNQRVIVLHQTANAESKSFSVRALRSIRFDNHWDGRATLYAAIADPDWPSANPRFPQPLFHFIDDHERLYAQLTKLRPELGIDPAILWTDPGAYVRTLLDPGEDLLWAGQPRLGLHIDTTGKHWYLLPAIWSISLVLGSILIVTALYGAGGAVIGFGFLILAIFTGCALLWSASRLRNDCYGVTDRRVLIANRRFGEPIGSPVSSLRSIGQVRHTDGTTTITSVSEIAESLRPVRRPLFRHIDNAEHVCGLLKKINPGIQDERTSIAARDKWYLDQLLGPNETLRWFDRPPSGWRRQGNDLLTALMSLLMVVAPLVLFKLAIDTKDANREGVGSIGNGAMWFVFGSGALLIIQGLSSLYARYWREAGKRNSVLYAVTNLRAIVAKHPSEQGTSVRSVAHHSISGVETALEPDGLGTISFKGEAVEWYVPNQNTGSYRRMQIAGPFFRCIKNPERVQALISKQQTPPPSPVPVPFYASRFAYAGEERLLGERTYWTGSSGSARFRDQLLDQLARLVDWTRDQRERSRSLTSPRLFPPDIPPPLPASRSRRLAFKLTDKRIVVIDPTSKYAPRRIPIDSLYQLFLQSDRHGNDVIYARSSVRDCPWRSPAGKPVAGPLFPGAGSQGSVFALMSSLPGSWVESQSTSSSSSAETQLGNWLREGEQLLWAGRPVPDKPISRIDFSFLLLLVVYVIVTVALIVGAYRSQPPITGLAETVPPWLWGLLGAATAIFLAYGVYRTYLRHFIDPHTWKSTAYGLTDQRAIAQSDYWVQSVPRQQLGTVKIERRGDGRGSLKCRSGEFEIVVFEELCIRCGRSAPLDGYLFKDILDPERVRSLMLDAQAAPAGKG